MDFEVTNVLGAPYKGGNIVISGNDLVSAVGNRVSMVDLTCSSTTTLPCETLTQVCRVCVSPCATLLMCFDTTGTAYVLNIPRKVLLTTLRLKGSIGPASFSPDGKYVAVSVDRVVQIWHRPSNAKSVSAFQLYKKFGQCHGNVTALTWSSDSTWIAVASQDLAVRIFTLHAVEGYKPPILAGHRTPPMGVYFTGKQTRHAAQVDGLPQPYLYTVASDCALFIWTLTDSATAGPHPPPAPDQPHRKRDRETSRAGHSDPNTGQSFAYADKQWALADKKLFQERGGHVTCSDYHVDSGSMVLGHDTGVFDIYQLPGFEHVQVLSVSTSPITSVCFNKAGTWAGVGVSDLGQLIVWDWRANQHVLKQQGHTHAPAALAFSPDGSKLVTGGDDGKVKVWSMATSACTVTFKDHNHPITQVVFLPSGNAVLSSSLDGTVRAFDLVRYRTFRTFNPPTDCPLATLATDPAGEVVAAASSVSYEIYVWSVQTGKLVDTLHGHEAPISCLQFSPNQPLLASSSWDASIRVWDVYRGGRAGGQILRHQHDVVALAYHPGGRQLASSTLSGELVFWDSLDGETVGSVEGRRDLRGGRGQGDRRAAGHMESGQYFSRLAYSEDGILLFAGGETKHICIYDTQDYVMLRRIQLSHDVSISGVVDMLNSRRMTDAGPLDMLEDSDSDDDNHAIKQLESNLPGGKAARIVPISCRDLALASTAERWAVATPQGVLLYSTPYRAGFEPELLDVDITAPAVIKACEAKQYLNACVIASKLKDVKLLAHAILCTPINQIQTLSARLPSSSLAFFLTTLSYLVNTSPHIEFVVQWLSAICLSRGEELEQARGVGGRRELMPALRAVRLAVHSKYTDMSQLFEANIYLMRYLSQQFSDSEDGSGGEDQSDASVDEINGVENGEEGASDESD